MANKFSFPGLGLTLLSSLCLEPRVHSCIFPGETVLLGYLTRQPEPVWQDVRSWGGFVFPLLKIFSLLKAEQVVMREFL